jgi:hypothetical protein
LVGHRRPNHGRERLCREAWTAYRPSKGTTRDLLFGQLLGILEWLVEQRGRGILVSLVRESDLSKEPDLLWDFAVYGDRATGLQQPGGVRIAPVRNVSDRMPGLL